MRADVRADVRVDADVRPDRQTGIETTDIGLRLHRHALPRTAWPSARVPGVMLPCENVCVCVCVCALGGVVMRG